MSGSSGFSWRVDGEIVDIIFSLVETKKWITKMMKNEYYHVHHFYSDIEFNYLNHKKLLRQLTRLMSTGTLMMQQC
jgi:hypothetical protein